MADNARPKWASRPIISETGNADIAGDAGYQHPVPGAYLDKSIAPWPAIDRYPLRIGQKRTLSYLSSVVRLCTIGYRMQFVDLLEELLEQDPHAYGALAKRVLGVARGKLTVTPARLEEGAPKSDVKLAQKIASEVEMRLLRIPRLKTELVRLAWACYYGITASEILWTHGSDWRPVGLSSVNSRRLAMPEWSQWRLFIWDQGPVSPWESFQFPTQAPLGLCIDELPGKFVVHCPPVRGDYPTREGLGLEIAYWMMLKHIAARGAPTYLERFAQPLPEMVWSTGVDPRTKEKKPADRRDIDATQSMMASMGGGRVAQISHPDTITLQYIQQQGGGGGGKPPVRFPEWIELVDAQISVAVNGATLTTKQGSESSGSRANGDTQRKDQINTWGADADALGESIRESIVKTDVRLNYPKIDIDRFCPNVDISLEEDPDPSVIAERASLLANAGYPVDATELEDMVGIPLANHEDESAIVMVPIQPQALVPPIRPSDPDKQAEVKEKADDLKANPPPPPPAMGAGLRPLPGGKAPPQPNAAPKK